MAEPAEDKYLINLFRQGDQDAARQIVDRYLNRLLTLARRRISQRLASRVDPEDIVQSVFRTFFVRVKDGQFAFDDQDDLCKLLMRITLHKTLRQVAFHKAGKRDPNLETPHGEHHHDQMMALFDQEPTQEATVAFLDQLEHFLAQLRPQEREILEMRLQGHSNEDIASKLGIYDRKIRRVIEHVRDIATKEGLTPGDVGS
jgi:RNA polymerase sigma-70 factor (ECF subfamily)